MALSNSDIINGVRKVGGHQMKGIAEHFHRDPVAISQGIKRLEKRLNEGKGIAKTIMSIEKSLTQKSSRKILIYLCLVPFRGIDVGEASKPFRVSSASLPNSITRAVIPHFDDSQIPMGNLHSYDIDEAPPLL